MVHHWRPSDNLEHTFRPGEWNLFDRGQLVGVIQFGRINGRSGLRGLSPAGVVLGYAFTLEESCDRLWGWYLALGDSTAAKQQPEKRADERQEERHQNPDELAEAAVVRVVGDRHDRDDEDNQADYSAADGEGNGIHVTSLGDGALGEDYPDGHRVGNPNSNADSDPGDC